MAQKKIIAKVDEDLHRRAKVEAAKRGVTLSEVVRDALAAFIGKPARKSESKGGAERRDTNK